MASTQSSTQSPAAPGNALASLTAESGAASSNVSDEDRAAFGQFLASAREGAGRSLEDIARSTKISRRYLDALERGHVEILPGGVYRRAMLRNYASAIGLDTRTALERFDRTFSAPAHPGPRGVTPPRAPQTPAEVPRLAIATHSAATRMLGSRVLEAATVMLVVVITAHFVAKRPVSVEARLAPSSQATPNEPGTGTAGDGGAARPAIAHASLTVASLDDRDEESPATDSPIEVEHRLAIASTPEGARVTVNGIAWGVTPLTLRHLPPGAKVIRVTKDGYVGRERRVNLGRETASASVQLTLDPRD